MAGYVKQGPWTQGDPFSADQATAMDEGIAAAQVQTLVDLGSVSGSVEVDASLGGTFTLDLAADVTLSITNMQVAGAMRHVTLFITANGFTVTWPGSLSFGGASAPSLTGSPDEITVDGLPSSILMAQHVGSY